VHKPAERPLPPVSETENLLGNLVLTRIASAARPVDKGEIAADLSVFAGAQMPALRWREAVGSAIEALAAAGRIAPRPGGFAATLAGTAAAARFLGVAASTPLTWEKACSDWLIAKALRPRGQRKGSARNRAAPATLDGMRAAILVQAHGLQIRGVATPARLRQALAAVALRKAFGGETAAAVAGKSGLPARASRLLAAQLMDKPRDPGTDRRLVSALAALACGARGTDLAALRAGVLGRAFAIPAPAPRTPPDCKLPAVSPEPALVPNARTQATPVAPRPASAAPIAKPDGAPVAPGGPRDLPGFAREVRRLAAGEAQGWSGDRKAYISRVWHTLRRQRPEWGLSEIEFKCMLAEAHRAGQLALANADLKDESNIKDVQDSAVIYRNAVFHFIRVDA
jgi:hypothetical protein